MARVMKVKKERVKIIKKRKTVKKKSNAKELKKAKTEK